MSTREQILKLTGRRFRKVGIPGIPDLTVQSLTELERAKVEVATKNPETLKRTIVIQSAICGKTGEKLFTDDDMELLAKLDSSVIDSIVVEAGKLSKISEEDMAALLGERVAS